MWEIRAVSVDFCMVCHLWHGFTKTGLSRQMFMTAGTYMLAHNGLSVIMLQGTQFRSVFLSVNIFTTVKVVEPEHCFIFYTFGVAVTSWLQTPCNVSLHHYHYHKIQDRLVGFHVIIILKWIFKNQGVRVCTVFIWLGIRSRGMLLWSWWCSFGFHKRQRFSWLAEQL
jgi:hypothetical protein